METFTSLMDGLAMFKYIFILIALVLIGHGCFLMGKKRVVKTEITNEHKTKIKNSKKKQAEDARSFPRLNIERLKDIVKRFVNKYPEFPTNSITLYRYHYDDSDKSPYPKMEYDPVHKNFYTVEKAENIKTKYALVYEIDAKVRESQDTMNKITVLRLATGRTKGNIDKREVEKLGIDAGFADVYIDKPSEEVEYLKEWNFYIILSDEEMPDGIMVDEEKIVLFSIDTSQLRQEKMLYKKAVDSYKKTVAQTKKKISNREKQLWVIKLTHTELKERTLFLVTKLRDFKNEYNEEAKKIDEDSRNWIVDARTEEERTAMRLVEKNKSINKHFLKCIDEYKNKFMDDAILFRDELSFRLSEDAKANRKCNDAIYDSPPAIVCIEWIADELEIWAKKLC